MNKIHRPAPGLQAAPAPSGCTSFRLRRLQRCVSQRYDAELARCGLKTTQYSLLSHVLRLAPVRPADLAQAMSLDASTLTRNLKPLVSAGWLAVGPGADDRSRLITITRAGRAKRSEAQRHWRAAQTALDDALGTAQVAALHDLIDHALERLAGDPAADDDE